MQAKDKILPPGCQKARYEVVETQYGLHENVLDVANSKADCVHLASQYYRRRLQEWPAWRVEGLGYICRLIKNRPRDNHKTKGER